MKFTIHNWYTSSWLFRFGYKMDIYCFLESLANGLCIYSFSHFKFHATDPLAKPQSFCSKKGNSHSLNNFVVFFDFLLDRRLLAFRPTGLPIYSRYLAYYLCLFVPLIVGIVF